MAPSRRRARPLLIALWLLVGLWNGSGRCQPVAVAPNETPVPRVMQLQGRLEPDQIIEVHVNGLAEWGRTPGHTPWRLVPFLDGRALAGLYPIAVNLRTSRVQFHLLITSDNRTTWTHVLSPLAFERAVRFSVGLEQQDPFETDFTLEGSPAVLTVINPRWVALAAAVVLVFSAAFCALAARTSMLMECTNSAPAPQAMRFSLAKVQLALWFFAVFGSFLVIWLVTGNFNTINSSIVATLGISVGTAVGDAYIKSARPMSESTNASDLPVLPSDRSPARFVRELVSDGEGYSIYRFQMLAWTVALVIVFLADVYDDLVMPSFGPELLYLLGVSSGTYVAHRVPEVVRDRLRPDAPPTPAASVWAASPTPPPSSPDPSPWGAKSSS
jgi:hypothetical protein